MTTNQQLVSAADRAFISVYKPAPIVLTEGKGCRIKDVAGREYLDMCAGVAVVSVGHTHPELVAAVSDQAARLMHVSNLFYNERAIELASELARRTPFDRFFFCNSGTEANEAMLKLALLAGRNRAQRAGLHPGQLSWPQHGIAHADR